MFICNMYIIWLIWHQKACSMWRGKWVTAREKKKTKNNLHADEYLQRLLSVRRNATRSNYIIIYHLNSFITDHVLNNVLLTVRAVKTHCDVIKTTFSKARRATRTRTKAIDRPLSKPFVCAHGRIPFVLSRFDIIIFGKRVWTANSFQRTLSRRHIFSSFAILTTSRFFYVR